MCEHTMSYLKHNSHNSDVYTHDNYYDCYALSNSHGVLTHNCYLFMLQ
jgi:hypothetical protein